MGCSSGELKNRNSITNGIRGPALFKAQPENILQLILAFLQGRGGKRRVRDRQLFLIFFSFLCFKSIWKNKQKPNGNEELMVETFEKELPRDCDTVDN
jgi:hypothetical protein